MIGSILSGSGLLFALSQYCVYAKLVKRWGIYPALKIGCAASVVLVPFIPLAVPLNSNAPEGHISVSAFIFLSVVMAVIRIFGMVFQSSMTMATNKTVSAHRRGTMNSLFMLGGSFDKGIRPAFAGVLTARLLSSGVVGINPRFGSVIIFGIIGGLGAAVAFYTVLVLG